VSASFNKYAEVYNYLYSDKDYASESSYIDELIKLYRPGSRTILEFGSGTGVHGRLFGNLGYETLGVEPSRSMIEFATETDNFTITQGDLRESSDYKTTFDVCLVLFHVFNYLTTLEEQKAAFANMRGQLAPGGLLFLEVWHGPAVESQKPGLRVKEVQGDFGHILRIARPTDIKKTSVSVNYDIFFRPNQDDSYNRIQETHVLRPTYPEDIFFLCEEANLEILDAHEFGSKALPSLETWSVMYLLRAVR
jgi:SAM-dependent methyltransferase